MIHLAYISLLNPAALLGFLALGLPIAIHLWSQRSGPPAWFPHLRFIQQSYQVRQRKTLPHQLLLLTTRLFLFTLLIMAATRPVWVTTPSPAAQASLQHQDHLLILDESAGMWREVEGESLALHHRTQAISFLRSLSPQLHRATVVILTDRLNQLNHSPTHDFQSLIRQIQQFPESHHAGQYTTKFRELPTQFNTKHRPHIQLWTDRAESSWPRPDDADQYLDPDTLRELSLKVHSPQSAKPLSNVAITGIQLEPEQLIQHQESSLSFQIKNFSDQPQITSLEIKGLSHPVIQQLTLQPQEEQIFSLKLKPRKTGRLLLEAQINNDDFPLDNGWAITLSVEARKQVYLLSPDQDKSKLSLSTLRLMQAIGGPSASPYQIKLTNPTDLSSFDSQTQRDSLFILHEAQHLQTHDWAQLKQLISNGAGLLILPQTQSRAMILHTGLLPLKRTQLADSKTVRFSTIGMAPELLRLFEGPSRKALLQQDWPLAYEGITLSDATALAQWNLDQPAIIQRDLGQGKIILLNTALNSRQTELYQSSLFLPILHEALMRLQSKAHSLSSQISFSLPISDQTYQVIGPDQQDRDYLSHQIDDHQLSLSPTPQSLSGTYQLLNENGQRIALAHRPFPLAESDLKTHEQNSFTAMLRRELQWGDLIQRTESAAQLADAPATRQAPLETNALQEHREFWAWLLFVAMIVAMLELVLATVNRKRNVVEESVALNQHGLKQGRKAA